MDFHSLLKGEKMRYEILLIAVVTVSTALGSQRFSIDLENAICGNETGLHWYCLSANGRVDVSYTESRISG